MHQDTKSARLIAVCKRTFKQEDTGNLSTQSTIDCKRSVQYVGSVIRRAVQKFAYDNKISLLSYCFPISITDPTAWKIFTGSSKLLDIA